MRQPDFQRLLDVLRRRPAGPVLFEFALNEQVIRRFSRVQAEAGGEVWTWQIAEAMANLGYDYLITRVAGFHFPKRQHERLSSLSLNEQSLIHDRRSFEAYPWPDPQAFDYGLLERAPRHLRDGQKIIVSGPGGVLENAVSLVGYEDLAMMVLDDPDLAGEIFDAVGSRLLRYYQIVVGYESVGAIVSNDDWGFAQQTMLSPEHLRRYVFPWHRRIVATAHAAAKPTILHSCGNLAAVMNDIIDDLKFDAKHSYEDKILPVEEAYERYGGRIAILGGIDVDFICRADPEQITRRCRAMLERTADRGGYALGTGNSVPAYVPIENYLAMARCVGEVYES